MAMHLRNTIQTALPCSNKIPRKMFHCASRFLHIQLSLMSFPQDQQVYNSNKVLLINLYALKEYMYQALRDDFVCTESLYERVNRLY